MHSSPSLIIFGHRTLGQVGSGLIRPDVADAPDFLDQQCGITAVALQRIGQPACGIGLSGNTVDQENRDAI
jgi:hypothetical protein